MRILALLFLVLLSISSAQAQNTASISGFIKDSQSGETLLLANVVLQGTQIGTTANTSGYYTLPNLPTGTYTVLCSFIGFNNFSQEVTISDGQKLRLDIELVPADLFLDEVLVTAEKEIQEEIRRIGVAQISTELIRQLPTILEPDVFRSLQLLPGVKAASDYSSGLYIRGGSQDQTLILLDRTTVYNPSHFFGLFSTFNPDAIKDVRLYKGGYPAEYGGRLGSVVDIYNKDGNRKETHGTASLGLLASRAMIEGPYSKGSWTVALRRSTLEPLLAAINSRDVDGVPKGFYFLDFNSKLNMDLGLNDKLSISGYAGQDVLDFPIVEDATLDLKYGNRTVSANWTHIFTEKLFSNFTGTYSRYFSTPELEFGGTSFTRVNTIDDYSLKGDFEYFPEGPLEWQGGFWAGHIALRLRDTFDGQESISSIIKANYASAYVQTAYKPNTELTARIGLRASYFGEGNFLRAEPRISLEYKPQEEIRIQLGYGRYYQFLTLITNEVFAGFDLWLTTDEGVKPAYGDQYIAGLKTRLSDDITLDTEVFYRTMRDLFELDPYLPDAAGLDYNELFRFGKGYSTGLEIAAQKTRGKVTGLIGYTFGVTRRQFPGFNNDIEYAPKYDRTHDANIVVSWQFARNWKFAQVFTYATGQAYTQPLGQYQFAGDPFGFDERTSLVGPFNNQRLPSYHRYDIGMTWDRNFFLGGDFELQFQIVNVYARRNIWFSLPEFEDGKVNFTEIPQIPIPLPNLSFTWKF